MDSLGSNFGSSSQDVIFIILLIISEILPFVQNSQANGVLHMVFVLLSHFLPTTTISELNILLPLSQKEPPVEGKT